ncbi:MAG: hypothetical protein LBM73_00640 [Candidatus Nomurabacteria bacterium]|jgi:hypothetical protein|nr:hypothetical protein [Candidatus Nomurabacteria bacterium]
MLGKPTDAGDVDLIDTVGELREEYQIGSTIVDMQIGRGIHPSRVAGMWESSAFLSDDHPVAYFPESELQPVNIDGLDISVAGVNMQLALWGGLLCTTVKPYKHRDQIAELRSLAKSDQALSDACRLVMYYKRNHTSFYVALKNRATVAVPSLVHIASKSPIGQIVRNIRGTNQAIVRVGSAADLLQVE